MKKENKDEKSLINVEINALSNKIEKVSIADLNNQVKITVDLNIQKGQEEKLEKQKLITPIREAENFKKIRRMKYANEIIKETPSEENNEALQKFIYEGEKAVEFLLKEFTPSAFNFAKSWIHNDRIIGVSDWNAIVLEILYNAIISYDLSKEVQFNTYLKFQIQRGCKETKCQSTTLSVNATAMHKYRTIEKIQVEMEQDGYDRDDIDELARRMNRDISTPNKRKNFVNVLLDKERISPKQVNLDFKKDDDTMSVSEKIASGDVTPDEYFAIKCFEQDFEKYVSTLSLNARNFLKKTYGVDDTVKCNKQSACLEMNTPEFHEILNNLGKLEGKANIYDILIKF